MATPTWIRNMFRRTTQTPIRRYSAGLAFLPLEDRCVPATYTPTQFTDSVSVTGVASLRDAILASNANTGTATDTINLAAGTYTLTIPNAGNAQENFGKTGDLDITSTAHKLVIQGTGVSGATATIIDASALSDRVFQVVNAGTVVEFKNLVISGGVARDNGVAGSLAGATFAMGGGLLNAGGTLTFTNVVFQGNTASGSGGYNGGVGVAGGNGLGASGGGLHSMAGAIAMTSVSLTGNIAQGGNGGVGGRSNVAFTPSFAGGDGSPGTGGGIYLAAGTLSIQQSTFASNSARGGVGGNGGSAFGFAIWGSDGGPGGIGASAQGGALAAFGAVTITDTSFDSDSANAGGGGAGGLGIVGHVGASDGGDGGTGGFGAIAQGGAIYAGAAITLTDTSFNLATAKGGAGGAGGGSTTSSTGTVPGTGGTGGEGASGQGGAVFAVAANDTFTDVTFTSNSALGGNGGESGGQANSGTVNGRNGGDAGSAAGGAAYFNGGTLQFTNLVSTANTALGGNGGSGSSGTGSTSIGGNGGAGGDGAGGSLLFTAGSVTLQGAAFSKDAARGGAGGFANAKFGPIASSGDGGDGGDAFGGTLHATAGTFQITGSTISNSTAAAGNGGSIGLSATVIGAPGTGGLARGGAAYAVNAGTSITFTNSSVATSIARAGNGAGAGSGGATRTSADGGSAQGGGLYAFSATVAVISSTFESNAAAGGIGGTESTTSGGNASGIAGLGGAAQGGALFLGLAPATVTNATLTGNSVTGGAGGNGGSRLNNSGQAGDGGAGGGASGGGVYIAGGTSKFSHTTIHANSAVGGAGGAKGSGSPSGQPGAAGIATGGGFLIGAGSVTLNNSIVAGSISDDVAFTGGTFTGGKNLIEDGTGGLANTITGDPMLAAPADNGGFTRTVAPLPNSPVLDVGTNANIPSGVTVDQRGSPRTYNTTVDLGAVEIIGFTGVTASQSITYGKASVTLAGHIGTGAFTPVGAAVTITIASTMQNAVLDSSGNFSVVFSTAAIPAGVHTVNYAFAGITDFPAAGNTKTTLTVAPKALTITASSVTKTYGTAATLSGTGFSSSGLINGDSITAITPTSTGSPATATVGTYPIEGSAATGTGLANYTITYANGTLTVNKAALTVDANDATKTYGTAATFSGTAFTQTGLVNGDTITGVTLSSTGAAATAVVGSFAIVPSAAVGTGLSNYNIAYVNGSLTVNKAALTIDANDVPKTYGVVATLGSTAFTPIGLLNSDTVTGVTLASTGAVGTATAGTYPIVASAAVGSGLANYTITYTNGTLTVSKAALIITANNSVKNYGTAVTLGNTAFSQTGLVIANGDTLSSATLISTGSAATAAAGTHPIVPSNVSGTGLANYTITYANGTLTVNKAPLLITPNNVTKTYGVSTTLGSTMFTSVGLLNGDTVTSITPTSTGSAATAAAGTHPIVASNAVGTGLVNYTITYDNGSLTVNKAALTVTASNAVKTYGTVATLPGSGFTTTGLLNSDTVTAITPTSTGSAATVAVGSYPIVGSAAVGTGLSNYTIAYANGSLTVNKAALTVTASNAVKTYGTVATLPGSGFTATGLLNSDTVTAITPTSTGSAATVAVGSYPIVGSAAVGTGLANYTITYANGTLTVNKAALTVTASNAVKTYGTVATLPGSGFTTTGLLNSDTVTAITPTSTGSAATVAVGSYPIVGSAAVGTGLSNYTITYANGSLTVNKAALTVTASNAVKTYGTVATLPGSGFTTTGLLNSDTVTAITPTSTGSAATVAVGSYPIVGSAAVGTGLANYTIAYANGSLTVNKAALTIDANDAVKTYGVAIALSTTAFTTTGLVNGDTVTSVTNTSDGAAASATFGTFPIVPVTSTGTGLSNYTITYTNGILTVNKAALTITPNNVTKLYGTVATLGTTAFSPTGLVTANGDTVTGVTLASTGTPAAAAAGSYPITATAATGTGLSNYTISYATGTLTVTTLVSSLVVNNGAAQRSRLTSITVNFVNPVNVSTLTGMALTRTSGGSNITVNSSNGMLVTPASGTVSSVTITFANILNGGVQNGSLADGRWRLTIPNLGYTSPLNGLHRLFGDLNGDGTVDGGSDFSIFALGNISPTTAAFDFNGDGTIDGGTDFAEFGTRFGRTV